MWWGACEYMADNADWMMVGLVMERTRAFRAVGSGDCGDVLRLLASPIEMRACQKVVQLPSISLHTPSEAWLTSSAEAYSQTARSSLGSL
jgi:hypothetical protein